MAPDSNASGPGATPPPTEAVLIKTFPNLTDGEMAASILRANKIAAWLQADDCGGMYPSLDSAQGVKLMVHAADAEAARMLLSAPPDSTDAATQVVSAAPAPHASLPRMRLALSQIAVGSIAGVLLCLLYQHTSQLGTHTYAYDNNHDGVPDNFMVYRDGLCVEQSLDRDFDGKPDSWDYYDTEGKRKEWKTDDNFDGRIDGTWRYTNGVAAEAKLDTDFNGTTDVTYFFQNDLLKEANWRPNGSMAVSLRQFFRNGMLAEEWRDTNRDGSFDTTNRFDTFQNRIETNTFRLISAPRR